MTEAEQKETDAEFKHLEDRIRMYHELYQKNQDRYKKLTGKEFQWFK